MRSLIRRRSHRANGHINGHGKTNANEDILFGGIHQCSHNANHMPLAIQQGAARIAGIYGGVNLNQIVQLSVTVGRGKGTVKTGDNPRTH